MATARKGHALAAITTTRLGQVGNESSCKQAKVEGVNSLMVHFSSPKAEVGRFGAIVLQLCKLSTANELHQIVLVTIQVKCAKLRRSARHSCSGQQSLRDCKESALMIAEVTCHIYGELQSCHITSVSYHICISVHTNR